MTGISTKNPKAVVLAALVAGAVLLAAPALAFGQGIFVRVDGIPGESMDGAHRSWIVASGCVDGMTPAAASTGTMMTVRPTASRGGIKFENIKIMKSIDKASPKLRLAAAESGVIKTVEIDFTRTDGQVFLHIVLDRVGVSEITSEFFGSEAKETVALSFGTITYTYTEYDSAGRSKGTVSFGWDVRAGKRL